VCVRCNNYVEGFKFYLDTKNNKASYWEHYENSLDIGISTLACTAPTVLGFFPSTQIFCRVSNGFRGSFVRDGEPFARHFFCGRPRVSGQVLDFPLQLLLHYFLPCLLCSPFLFLEFLESVMLVMMMMMMVKLMVPLCTLSILFSSLCECALQHCSVRVLHLFFFSQIYKV
jgi:hypothetical protein